MREPSFWARASSWQATALAPLAALYGAGEAMRRRLTRPQETEIPVICIGGLTAGGAGKTPVVRMVAELLQELRPAVLSRGFGGTTREAMKVEHQHHRAALVGDEPLMLARDLPVYVARDRRAAFARARADGVEICLKDDGFQNPTLAHAFNLIVIDGARGVGNARLLPAGALRQPLAAAVARLDALLVIGDATHPTTRNALDLCTAAEKPVLHARIEAVSQIAGQSVFAYCGIAHPEKFFESLRASGATLADTMTFDDHHAFDASDCRKILDAADAPLITTEKDMARLLNYPPDAPQSALATRSQVFEIRAVADAPEALTELLLAAINR